LPTESEFLDVCELVAEPTNRPIDPPSESPSFPQLVLLLRKVDEIVFGTTGEDFPEDEDFG
jgi:hypothetical protein